MAQYNAGFSSNSQSSYMQQQYETREEYTSQQVQSGTLGGSGQLEAGVQLQYDAPVPNSGLYLNQFDRADGQGGQLEMSGTMQSQSANYQAQGVYGGQDQLQVAAVPASGTLSHKQEFEARRSHSRQQSGRGQASRDWRSVENNYSSYSMQHTEYAMSYSADTVDTGRQAKAMSEDEYRDWLAANFKHLFDPYESMGGMPMEEFQKMVNSSDLRRTRNLKALFTRLDKDKNNRVSWQEFFTGMKYTKTNEVPKRRKAVNKFITAMTPVANKKTKREKELAAADGEPIPEESYLEAYNCRPPPLFIPIFYVACWIFFIIYAIELQSGPAWNRVGWETGFPFQSPLVFCTSTREQVWRFITYSLLHDGYHHIIFNTIFSLFLGVPLECVHKFWRVGPVFMIGVLFGSLASSIADPGTPLIGASGGVYALIGAHYAIIIMNWEELQDDWTNIRKNPLRFLLSGVMRLIYLTIIVVFDFGMAAYKRYAGTVTLPVSAVAHIGGLLAGLFSGVPILRNIDKKPWEGIAFIVCLVITAVLFLFGVLWNIIYQSFPAKAAAACSNPSLLLTGK